MPALHEDYATLLADTLSFLQAFQQNGGRLLPVGELEGLPAPEPFVAAAPGVAARPAAPPATRPAPPRAAPAPAAPAIARPTAPTSAATAPATVARPAPTEARPMAAGWGRIMHGPEEELRRFREEVSACRLCARCDSRSRVLPGFGPAKADLVVLLPPPEEREELEDGLMLGDPGAVFDKMLLNVVKTDRSRTYLMPALFCRGGKPSPDELNACRPLVARQLAILKPKVVLAMGEEVLALLGSEARRGAWLSWAGLDVMPTWHPNELVRDPTKRRPTMEHLQQVGERLAQVPLFGAR